MTYFVYMLKCSDGSLYTGATNNLEKRVKEHQTSKNGARYTKSRRPVALVYVQKCRTFAYSRKREAEIKRLSRTAKLKLLKHFK